MLFNQQHFPRINKCTGDLDMLAVRADRHRGNAVKTCHAIFLELHKRQSTGCTVPCEYHQRIVVLTHNIDMFAVRTHHQVNGAIKTIYRA
jgi:hypothetical protein